ncbi:hypothetical protein K435DRAFT_849592 [Dendrothele bispora CBS 962.96]|uniref:Uncharacterized protein n=1 Tax=Dendrothele bispora (strain CBS 962.96) TaxID=1314807 RepID=A0A4S8MRW7_DENBC|nr:hypothetical protein K435DRAFT_849592 [Dendrothele bispora CBS 962.96]
MSPVKSNAHPRDGLFSLMIFSTTAWFSIVASEQYHSFHYIFHPVNGDTPSLTEWQKVEELLFEKLFSVSPFLQGINASFAASLSADFIAADSTAVWRALSLWPEKKYLRYMFGFWIFASACIALADGFNTVAIKIRAAGDASKVNGWQKLNSSSVLVSLSINVAATTLIFCQSLANGDQTHQMWGNTNLGLTGFSSPHRMQFPAINTSVSLHNGNSSSLGSLEMFVQSFAVMSPILAGIYPSIVLLIVRQQSTNDGGTDLVIFDTTISNRIPKFNLTQHGHENYNGHDLTSVTRFITQGSDLKSRNGNLTTFWSRGNPEGLSGSNVHRGEESSAAGVSNKDNGVSQCLPKELGA